MSCHHKCNCHDKKHVHKCEYEEEEEEYEEEECHECHCHHHQPRQIEHLIVVEEPREYTYLPDSSTAIFSDHTDSVNCVAISPVFSSNGSIIFATGGSDNLVYLHYYKNPTEFTHIKLEGHKSKVSVVSFSSDGSLLASGGSDGRVRIWDSFNGSFISKLIGPPKDTQIIWFSWHPSPKLPAVVAGDGAGSMWMWNARTGKCVKVYCGHVGPVIAGGFKPDATEMWSVGDDASLHVWTPKTGEITITVRDNVTDLDRDGHKIDFHRRPITCGSISPNGTLFITGDEAGIVKLVRSDYGKVLGQLDAGVRKIMDVQFSSDSQMLAVASRNCSASVWSHMEGDRYKMRHALIHPGPVLLIRWHPKKPYIITACEDGAVRLFDARNGEKLHEFGGHTSLITGIAVKLLQNNTLMIITSSQDKTARIFDFKE